MAERCWWVEGLALLGFVVSPLAAESQTADPHSATLRAGFRLAELPQNDIKGWGDRAGIHDGENTDAESFGDGTGGVAFELACRNADRCVCAECGRHGREEGKAGEGWRGA